MWQSLPESERNEYRRMILAFSALSEMFAQKNDESEDEENVAVINIAPIINTKYQEKIFSKVFHATIEDISNSSYDASINHGKDKYLVGIKTFGIASGAQKIAQFKQYNREWTNVIQKINENSERLDSKAAINMVNNELYYDIAVRVSEIRNARIDSSIANLKGFNIDNEDNVESIYHVLMPSKKGDAPRIYVGEISYDKINIENIQILGCTKISNPANFDFTDGNHIYRFAPADNQLFMKFNNREIVEDEWEVTYVDDAYDVFSKIADDVIEKQDNSFNEPAVTESYTWAICDENGVMPLFSGFNACYGVGLKLGPNARLDRAKRIPNKFADVEAEGTLLKIRDELIDYINLPSSKESDKIRKAVERDILISNMLNLTCNRDILDEVNSLVYRPRGELYIPIRNNRTFHVEHPDFFCHDIDLVNCAYDDSTKAQREFNLVFEPSGMRIRCSIVQQTGKGIESVDSQAYLGEWILREVFQLKPYEPLTYERLRRVGINAYRLYKVKDSADIHLIFTWVDFDNLPKDFIAGA